MVFDKSVVWNIRNQDENTSSEYAVVLNSTGNGATIKASNASHIGKYVILKASLSDDVTVFKEFTIQIKGIY